MNAVLLDECSYVWCRIWDSGSEALKTVRELVKDKLIMVRFADWTILCISDSLD